MEEIKKLIQAQGDAFAEYKKTMNEQIEALKKQGGTGEIQAKMDKILADYDKQKENLDKVHADLQTLKVSPAGSEDPKMKAHKEAFHAYIRKNDPSKMLNLAQVGVDADGGYTCPVELSNRIISIVEKSNPIRQLADVQTPTSGQLDILTDPNEMTASRTAEAGTRSETSTPQVGKISIVAEEMYCYPKVTQRLLEDSAWDFENWLVGKASRAFSTLERTEMATGNGVGCSEGITSPTTVADASWSWGKLGFVVTGQAAAISTDGGDLIGIVDALEDAYKANAAWVFNKAAFTSYRKLRAGANAANMFLFWTPSLQAGVPDRFLDYPVYKMSTMPIVAANAMIAAFGDFKAGYTIADRTVINVIRDNITSPGFVKLHMRRRSTGRVTNFEAIKLLKVSA
jgi:HK97 family phage major capsid protein